MTLPVPPTEPIKPTEKPTEQKPVDTAQPPNETQQPNDDGGELDFDKLDPKTQRFVKSLREENKTFRLAQKSAKDAADAAEAERLKAQGEWQKLAQNAQTELAEIKPFKEKAEALEALFSKQVERRIKELPEQFRKLVPEKYNTLEKWEWLEANAAAFQTKVAPNLDPGAGNQTATPGAQQVGSEAHLKDVAQRFRLKI